MIKTPGFSSEGTCTTSEMVAVPARSWCVRCHLSRALSTVHGLDKLDLVYKGPGIPAAHGPARTQNAQLYEDLQVPPP